MEEASSASASSSSSSFLSPAPINPNNFPAKLWRLVNSPRFRSIRWDARGEGLLIDQPLFEAELLGAANGGGAAINGGGGDGAGGPPASNASPASCSASASAASELFKTTNFTSFIRQLNLYGFRKVVLGPPGGGGGGSGGGAASSPSPGSSGTSPAGAGAGLSGGPPGPVHHFHSPHFRRDRPDLLVHLKRLTSANKAKLAAGLEVTSRPPNRFQRLLSTSLHHHHHPQQQQQQQHQPQQQQQGGEAVVLAHHHQVPSPQHHHHGAGSQAQPSSVGGGNHHHHQQQQQQHNSPAGQASGVAAGSSSKSHDVKPAPLTLGQFHRSFRRDTLSPYSYLSPPSHNPNSFLLKGSDRTPLPPRTWQNSLGMLPGQVEASAFSDKGVPFPMLQRFPTEVTYTLQPNATSVHIQQGPPSMGASAQKYTSYAASVPYSQAYYPTAVLQCCSPPTHMDPLSGCGSPTASTYTHCSYFQNPPMQSSYPVEFLPSNWSCGASDETKKTEVNLEAVFQIVDEMHSSPKLEMVKVEPVESQCPASQPNRGQQLLVNAGNGDTPSSGQDSHLEPLTPVGSEITSFMVESDQGISCSSLPQSSEFIYTIHTAEAVENAAAHMVPLQANPQQPAAKLKEQLNPAAAQASMVFVQEGLPYSQPQQENLNIKCQTRPAEAVVSSEQIGFLISEVGPLSKCAKDAPVQTKCRERRSSSQKGKSPDLHLLVDVACKQEHFPKEEELRE